MAGTGEVVEQAARNNNIDDAFALAVWWAETNDGTAGVGLADRNPGSIRGSAGYPAAFDGYTIYPSYAIAISDWFTLLHNRYVNQGLTSVYTICYPYVATSGATAWANKVVNLMLRYHGGTPIITGTPIPVVPPAPKPIIHKIPTAVVRTPVKQKSTHSGKAKQEIKRAQHQPITVGQWQLVAQTSGQTAQNKQPGRSSLTLQERTDGIFTAPIQQFLIVLALLAAILVLLPRILIKRKEHEVTQEERVTGRLIVFPPSYVNEYSPVDQYSPVVEEQEDLIKETGPLPGDNRIPVTPFLQGMGVVPLTPFVVERDHTVLRRARLVSMEQCEHRGTTDALRVVRVLRAHTSSVSVEER
jgi:hypothetical protein